MTPTVSRQEIDELKAAVDLVALLRVHGVAVQKSGRGFRALCPFHEEKTPSLSVDPKKGVYHCFGCGQSGDSLTFLQSHAKLSFAKAVTELRRLSSPVAEPTPTRPESDPKEALPYELL